ncbi:hypothetical protein ACEQGU_004634 [Salmonella enterica]|nr:hypothetical protein [Escherichia coli]MDJ8312878.1 hypothetical protein [Salmonella enterica]
MTKPQRKRLTRGKTRERVQAAGFSLTLFQDRNGVASVTAKVNTADDGWEETPEEAGLPAFISGRTAASESRVAGTATEGVLTSLRECGIQTVNKVQKLHFLVHIFVHFLS